MRARQTTDFWSAVGWQPVTVTFLVHLNSEIQMIAASGADRKHKPASIHRETVGRWTVRAKQVSRWDLQIVSAYNFRRSIRYLWCRVC